MQQPMILCPVCQAQISASAATCPKCGQQLRSSGSEAASMIVPYRNAWALFSYYCGVFSLIPCLGGVLGPIAVILGFLGLMHRSKHPEAHGSAHAIVGLILGGLSTLAHILVVILMATGAILS